VTAQEAVVYAAIVGAAAGILGAVVAGVFAALTDSRRQEREERHRVAAERRAAYADLSKEMHVLLPADRDIFSREKEDSADLSGLELAYSRVMTVGSEAVSEAAKDARKAVITYHLSLKKVSPFDRMKAGLEVKAVHAIQAYAQVCREEARKA
jgi:type II secretory pathway pseudopilin PulG